MFAFHSIASTDYMVQFNFAEDIIISGIIITTNKANYVKEMRLRANLDKNFPYLFPVDSLLPEDIVSNFILYLIYICEIFTKTCFQSFKILESDSYFDDKADSIMVTRYLHLLSLSKKTVYFYSRKQIF